MVVLHVGGFFAGGVDRHVRDIVRSQSSAHLIWHAGESADVIEEPRENRFHALQSGSLESGRDAMARWLRARGVGLVHLHSSERAARARAALACEALGAPQVTTLHDILFLRPDAFEARDPEAPDGPWLAQVATDLRRSKAVLAPSEYVAALARRHVPGLEVEVVPNGSPAPRAPQVRANPAFLATKPARVVAVLGAIGPHKGARMLDELAVRLEGSDIAIVVIGYLDRQLVPGWMVPGRLFVHGAFTDDEAPALLAAYGAQLVLFPGAVPESFSYALSDAWSAGVPVLVPPVGALGERVSRHGGGWLLPANFDAQGAAGELRALVGGARESERARVQSELARPDPARVPRLETMTRSLDALYSRFGISPDGAGDAAAIERLLAANLDGVEFRKELIRLAADLAQTRTALADTVARANAFEIEARAWVAKLEGDVKAVQADLEASVAERRRQGQEIVQLQIQKDAFDLLPEILRKILLKKILNARR
jgi:glycosyltransferase involved in cell wall biosynthesis